MGEVKLTTQNRMGQYLVVGDEVYAAPHANEIGCLCALDYRDGAEHGLVHWSSGTDTWENVDCLVTLGKGDDYVDPQREAEEDELFATGDPRRCPRHPHIATSSPDGLFDAPCGACEAECDEYAARRRYESPTRKIGFCAPIAHCWGYPPGWRGLVTCLDTIVDLPF